MDMDGICIYHMKICISENINTMSDTDVVNIYGTMEESMMDNTSGIKNMDMVYSVTPMVNPTSGTLRCGEEYEECALWGGVIGIG
jgi:hypothetical protein